MASNLGIDSLLHIVRFLNIFVEWLYIGSILLIYFVYSECIVGVCRKYVQRIMDVF